MNNYSVSISIPKPTKEIPKNSLTEALDNATEKTNKSESNLLTTKIELQKLFRPSKYISRPLNPFQFKKKIVKETHEIMHFRNSEKTLIDEWEKANNDLKLLTKINLAWQQTEGFQKNYTPEAYYNSLQLRAVSEENKTFQELYEKRF